LVYIKLGIGFCFDILGIGFCFDILGIGFCIEYLEPKYIEHKTDYIFI
jgi:hypothetical protein